MESVALFVVDSHFDNTVLPVFEQLISLCYSAEWKAMCYEWCGVNLSLFDKLQHLLTVAAVYAASLEREVLAVHVWQGQSLRLIV